ncbi:MAG: hypothetical protein A2Y33_13800 [Spirochaetes bacterium GWF1_51_8]|nr:MAG: hypothetical protein A2Y33_13800 [Spirochaetes bacterium GWF1_51_8]
MRRVMLYILSLLFTAEIVFAQTQSNPYSHLIGISTGGQYFFNSRKADWISGIYFETVLDQSVGIDIHLMRFGVPITNYAALVGHGLEEYFQFGAGVKFYMGFWKPLSLDLGIDYHDFSTGYLVYNNDTNYQVITSDDNFFAVYAGLGITAQISADLFAQIGVRFSYDFTPVNEAMGLRAYFAFGYGI